jgi:hypothetical protein
MERKEQNNISVVPPTEILCPGCGERLQPVDLESCPRCPYCDFEFASDPALEDFVLSPIIRRWLRNLQQNFPNC